MSNTANLEFFGSISLLDSNLKITLLGPQVHKLGYNISHWTIQNEMSCLGICTTVRFTVIGKAERGQAPLKGDDLRASREEEVI